MSGTQIRIAISGASGRMGRTLIRAVNKEKNATLGAALSYTYSNMIGIDAGALAGIHTMGIKLSDSLEKNIDSFDILIDFSRPENTLRHLDICVAQRKPIVIGTTGFNDAGNQAIQDAARHIGIVSAANFSVGANLVLKLLERAAQVMGNSSDIEIIEAHHRKKIDAPSGTALAMGQVIDRNIRSSPQDSSTPCGKKTPTGLLRPKNIGFSILRAGDIIGEHTVMFVDIGERVEIIHKASSRMSFATGAIRAAFWLHKKEKGLFDMWDVLGFN